MSKRKYDWHCYQCGNYTCRKQFNKQDNFICSKCSHSNKRKVKEGDDNLKQEVNNYAFY